MMIRSKQWPNDLSPLKISITAKRSPFVVPHRKIFCSKYIVWQLQYLENGLQVLKMARTSQLCLRWHPKFHALYFLKRERESLNYKAGFRLAVQSMHVEK